MARRRKRTKTTPKTAQNGAASAKEKALPSLPPGAVPQSAFSPEAETPPTESYSGTPARSPPERHTSSRRDKAPGSIKREVSPLLDDAQRGGFTCAAWLKHLAMTNLITDGPTLPASTYGDPRPSNVSRDSEDGEERGFLPMAFDPNPVPGPPSISRKEVPRPHDISPPARNESRQRDYFSRLGGKTVGREVLREEPRPGSSRSVSTEREPERSTSQAKSSPHILFQDKGRQKKRETSGNNTPASGSTVASPSLPNVQENKERSIPQQFESSPQSRGQTEGFKLQEVPQSKKMRSRSGSKLDTKSPNHASPASLSPIETVAKDERTEKLMSQSPVSVDSPGSSINPFDDPKRKEGSNSSAAPVPPKQADRPTRGDSLTAAVRKAKTPTPDLQTPTMTSAPVQSSHERKASTSSVASLFADAQSTLSRDNSRSKPLASPAPGRGSFDAPPPRASSRPSAQTKTVPEEEFTAPRAPPPPPPASAGHRPQESVSTLQSNEFRSEGQPSPAMRSAGLPKQSMDAPFSMEEEMARIMRGDSKRSDAPPSVLRKVSNAVKHGRSFSDRGMHSAKSSSNGAIEISSPINISSPMLYSPTAKDTNEQLSAQLKRAQQRIAELESEVNRLEDKVDSSAEIKAANNELREKRTTMVVLDTQREMVVRELEIMTEHLSKAKDSSQPLDLNSLKTEILKDFAESLQKLKEQMTAQIEDLMHKRHQLTEEITNLIQMKDKGFQEYESLSTKNAQLQEMNNQIMHNIQELYKQNRAPHGPPPTANGLGIYHPGAKADVAGPSEVRKLNLVDTDSSMPNLLQETEAEPATVLTAPQVVNIRKGQPKKFNWRKGGEKMAKNVTKGIKGAFAGERRDADAPYSIGMPYNQTQQAVGGSEFAGLATRQGLDANRPGAPFGLFAQKNGAIKPGSMKDNSSGTLTAADASGEYRGPFLLQDLHTNGLAVLFGSELEARCEYERRVIPSIVNRCIEEVEARGMDNEGIYRKSGGAGQVKIVQQGFEKDSNYDISDPDLDIHSVTSALKQYFRKLPTPLITYDVYDNFLEAGRLQDRENQALALRATVAELPEHHRDCLEYLVQHLARVMAQESENLMTSLNLAVVFAPTIMRPLSIEREMSDMQSQRYAVQALLEHNKSVFPDE